MDDWFVRSYGDPCRECGFAWGQDPAEAVSSVADLPDRFEAAIGGTDGSQIVPELRWSARAYVFHVADNLRIWAERLEGVRAGAPPQVASYDPDLLADARRYEQMQVQAGLWSLRRSVEQWTAATRASLERGTVLDHPERGVVPASDSALAPAHDAHHHLWDVTRILDASA